MPRYPTEAKHGERGYRRNGGLSEAFLAPPGLAPLLAPVKPSPVPVPAPVFPHIGFGLGLGMGIGLNAADPFPWRPWRGELYPPGFIWDDFVVQGEGSGSSDPGDWITPANNNYHFEWNPCEVNDAIIGNGTYIFSTNAGTIPEEDVCEDATPTGLINQVFDSPPDADIEPGLGPDWWWIDSIFYPLSDGQNGTHVILWEQRADDASFSVERGTWHGVFHWTGPSTMPNPFSYPTVIPSVWYPYARPVPAKHPELWPINKPVEIEAPTYPETLPDTETQPALEPEVRPRVMPSTIPMPSVPGVIPAVIMPPAVSPAPGEPVVPVAPPEVVVVPGGFGEPPNVTIVQNPVGRTPPRGREKVQKAQTSAGPKAIRVVVNGATEFGDFINSLYAGVPRALRKHNCHHYDYVCQLKTLWDVWDDPRFDASEFVEAFLNNQFEDMIYGMLGQQLGSASRNLHILTGLNRAINAGGDAFDEFMEENEIEAPDLLPELVHDATTDTWSLEWELFGISQPLTGP